MRVSEKFLSDVGWSLTGSLASAAAGLLTVKIATARIETPAYGQASLLLGAVSLLSGFLIGPLLATHLRFYFDYWKRGLANWFASVYRSLLLASCTVVSVGYCIFGSYKSRDGEPLYWDHAWVVVVLLLVQPQLVTVANYFEAHRQQRHLALLNILIAGLPPCFLVGMLAVVSPVDALLLSYGVAFSILLLLCRRPRDGVTPMQEAMPTHDEWPALLVGIRDFGWVLPMIFLAQWFLATGDRYLLQYLGSTADVGLYAMNYGLWALPFVVLTNWLDILTRPIIFEAAARLDWRRVKKIVFARTIFGVVASVAMLVAITLFAEVVANAMLGRYYWAGTPLAVTIAAAHCFYVLGFSLTKLFIAAKRLHVIFYASMVAAVINLAANWILIPHWGIIGAGYSLLLAYIIWAALLMLAAAGFAKSLQSYHRP